MSRLNGTFCVSVVSVPVLVRSEHVVDTEGHGVALPEQPARTPHYVRPSISVVPAARPAIVKSVAR